MYRCSRGSSCRNMNAMEAMNDVDESTREIVISTQNLDEDQVVVSVEDSGRGLDANAANRIFEPFYTTKSGGMVSEARIFGSAKVQLLTIPGEAIVPDAQGAPNVYIYFPDRKRVYARRVEIGPPIGTEVEIRSGLRGGEQIVISGQQKVREGSVVEISGGAQ